MANTTNPFYRPTWYDVEHEMDVYNQTKLANTAKQLEIEAYKKEQARQAKLEEALKRAPKAYAEDTVPSPSVNPTPAPVEPPKMVPVQGWDGKQVMLPEGAMTLSQTPTSPFGTTAPANYETMAPGQSTGVSPAQQQVAPQVQAKPQESPLVKRTVDSKNELIETAGRIKTLKSLANQAQIDGDVTAFDHYNKQIDDATKSSLDQTKAYLTNVGSLMDRMGQIAQGYKTAVAKGENPDTAWSRALMEAQMLGPMGSQLANLPYDKRDAFVEGIISSSQNAAIRTKEQIAAIQAETSRQRAKLSNEMAEKRLAQTRAHQAVLRELSKDRINLQERKLNLDENNKNIKLQVDAWTGERNEIDKDVTRLSKSLEDLQKGNMFFTADGQAMTSDDPDTLVKEATLLKDAIANKLKDKEELTTSINKLSSVGISNKGGSTSTSEGKPTKDDINLVIEAINSNKTKAAYDKIKANFEKLHPGHKLEEFVKFDTNKLK